VAKVANPIDHSPKLAHVTLAAKSQNRLKAEFYCFALGFQTCFSKRLTDQLLVNNDIGSLMCIH
jgi:hypothetical protein